MIWIIAGTSEAREIIYRIKDLDSYIATVTTEEGKRIISSTSDKVMVGRMDYGQMKNFVETKNISLIVDLSHPYADIVSKNAKELSEKENIKYIRYIREKTKVSSKAIYLKGYKKAYEYLSKVKGTVFFTTGSKNISDFEKIKGDNRFIYRVLPALSSIKTCNDENISLKNILAMLGPFSMEYNKMIFSEYKANYVIMKDSGKKVGTLEKIKACEELNISPIVIEREDEEGIKNLDEIEAIIRKNT